MLLFLSSASFSYNTDISCSAALADLIKFDVFHDWLYPMCESDVYEWNVDVKSVIDIILCVVLAVIIWNDWLFVCIFLFLFKEKSKFIIYKNTLRKAYTNKINLLTD